MLLLRVSHLSEARKNLAEEVAVGGGGGGGLKTYRIEGVENVFPLQVLLPGLCSPFAL